MTDGSKATEVDVGRSSSNLVLTDRVAMTLIDSAPDGLVIVDESGQILLANRQAEDMFGYHRDQLLGQPVELLLPSEIRDEHQAHRRSYQAAPRTRTMGSGLRLEAIRRNDSRFPVEISLSPLVGEDGRALVIAAVRDITERVEAEALDREIRHGLDVVEDGVFMFDAATLRFRYVNEGAVAQVGYSRTELLGMTPVDLKPEFTDASFRQLLEPLLTAETSSVHLTTLHRHRDGTSFPVEIFLQSPSPTHGEDQACVALVRDIRERLDQEQELASALQQASLLADRERMARDMHDTVIQELFASGMALQATTTTIDNQETADRIMAVVDSIDLAIKQIRGTIFDLRTNQAPGRDVEGQLHAVAESTREALGFRPSIAIAGDVSDVPERIIDHLLPTMREALANTARHAEASRVEVEIETDDQNLVLRVVDNGVGLPDEAAGRGQGQGLRNMQDRAVALGGSCRIAAHEFGGTEVLWRVPRQRDDRAQR